MYIYFYPLCQDRMVEPPTDIGGHVAAFAWHPRDENTLLVAGNYGRWVTVSANQSPVSDISDQSQLSMEYNFPRGDSGSRRGK